MAYFFIAVIDKKRTRSTSALLPSHCRKEKETSALGFVTKLRKVFFFLICILLWFKYTPPSLGLENGHWGVGIFFFVEATYNRLAVYFCFYTSKYVINSVPITFCLETSCCVLCGGGGVPTKIQVQDT